MLTCNGLHLYQQHILPGEDIETCQQPAMSFWSETGNVYLMPANFHHYILFELPLKQHFICSLLNPTNPTTHKFKGITLSQSYLKTDTYPGYLNKNYTDTNALLHA